MLKVSRCKRWLTHRKSPSQTESMFQGSLAKTSVSGDRNLKELAVCVGNQSENPFWGYLVRLLFAVAWRNTSKALKANVADCQSPLKLFRAVVSPKVFQVQLPESRGTAMLSMKVWRVKSDENSFTKKTEQTFCSANFNKSSLLRCNGSPDKSFKRRIQDLENILLGRAWQS